MTTTLMLDRPGTGVSEMVREMYPISLGWEHMDGWLEWACEQGFLGQIWKGDALVGVAAAVHRMATGAVQHVQVARLGDDRLGLGHRAGQQRHGHRCQRWAAPTAHPTAHAHSPRIWRRSARVCAGLPGRVRASATSAAA